MGIGKNSPSQEPAADRIRWLCDQFKQAWQSGNQPRIEDYLVQVDESIRSPLLTELLRIEFDHHKQAGQAIHRSDYAGRFPSYGRELNAVFGTGESSETQDLSLRDFSSTVVSPDRVVCGSEETIEGSGFAVDVARGPNLGTFGAYEILAELGRGGMGVVYKARQNTADRLVALKVIRADRFGGENDPGRQEAVERFRVEAKAAARLQHDNLVTVYEVGEVGGQPFFSMRYIEGQSLKSLLKDGPLDNRRAAAILLDVAQGVSAAHQHGILHRDLKPDNVLIETASGRAMVADFGLAKLAEEHGMTLTGVGIGTPQYMPPEQASDAATVTVASDIYSLGATLYHLLTGRPPFRGELYEVLRKIKEEIPAPPRQLNPRCDADLETLCLKCLEKQPAKRFSAVQELIDELERYLDRRPILSRPIGKTERLWRWCKRKPLAAAFSAAVVVLAMVIALAVGLARHATESNRLAELNRQFEVGLDRPELSAAYLGQMDRLIGELRRFSPEKADEANQRLNAEFVQTADKSLRRPRLSEADVAEIRSAIELLAERAPDSAQSLQNDLTARLTDWQTLLAFSPPMKDVQTVFAQNAMRVNRDGLLEPVAKKQGPITLNPWLPPEMQSERLFAPRIESRVSCAHDVQWLVRFDPSWEKAHEVGLSLNASGKAGYDFVLRVLSPLPPPTETTPLKPEDIRFRSLGTARAENGEFVMEIRRNGIPLVRQPLSEKEIPSGPLRFFAAREKGQLRMQINWLKPLEIYDPFQISGGRPGVFALRLTGEVAIRELKAESRRQAASASGLERGDELFNQEQYDLALEEYRRQALVAEDPLFRQEARYKQGRCLMEQGRRDEAQPIFEKLFAVSGERWSPLAGLQLWLILIRKDEHKQANELFQLLSSRYRFEQLAALVPSQVREEIIAFSTKPDGLFRTMLMPRPDYVRDMERAAAIDRYLSYDGNGTLDRQLDLGLAYMVVGKNQTAAEILGPIAERRPVTRAIRHYVRALRHTGRLHEAYLAINQAIDAVDPDKPAGTLHLLIDRARVLVAVKDYAKAEQDVLKVLSFKDPNRDPATYARLIHGFLLEQRGDAAGAVACWRDGYRESRSFLAASARVTSTEALNILIMGSLSGEMTQQDALPVAEKLLAQSNNPLFNVFRSAVSPNTFASVFCEMWRTPRGRDIARGFAYESLSFQDRTRLPLLLGAATYVQQSAVGKSLTPEDEALVWQVLETQFDQFFRESRITSAQAVQLGLAWKGTSGFLGWGGVAPQLERELRAQLAYIMGHRYIRLGQTSQAAKFFETSQRDAPADSLTAQLAAKAGQLLKAGRGRLVCEPKTKAKPLVVHVLQNKKRIATLRLPDQSEVALEPGTYQVKLDPEDPGIQLSPDNLTIRLAGTTLLTADAGRTGK